MVQSSTNDRPASAPEIAVQRAAKGLPAFAIAVSGGLDSTTLLHCAARFADAGARVFALHVDHGLRGTESREDAAFVRDCAERLGLPFRVTRLQHLVAGAPGLAAAARASRYEALARMARAEGLNEIWTAHHEDDQLETLALRVKRRSGPFGLCGIRERRALAKGLCLTRPWLGVTRSEIRALAETLWLRWREDSSNQSLQQERNLLRHRVLDAARPGGHAAARALSALHRAALSYQEALESLAGPFSAQYARVLGPRLVHLCGWDQQVPRDLWQEILREAFAAAEMKPLAGSARRAIEALDAASSTGRRDLGEGLAAIARAGGIDLVAAPDPTTAVSLREDQGALLWPLLDQLWRWQGVRGSAAVQAALDESQEDPAVQVLDADRIEGDLRLRGLEAGERWRALGAPGSQRLARSLQARGLPAHLRERVAVLADARGALWVAGGPPAARVAVRKESERALVFRVRGEVP